MDINVTVENIDLDSIIATQYDSDGEAQGVTLGARIARIAAGNLAHEAGWKSLAEQVREMRTTIIRELVAAEVTAAMTQPIQMTNTYGEPVGPSTTLREMVLAEARDFFTKKVGGDYRNPGTTMAAQVVTQVVQKELTAGLIEAVKDEKQKVVAAVRGKTAAVLAEAIESGLRR